MQIITQFNNIMWGSVLVIILLGTGLIFSVVLKAPQIRCVKHIAGSLKTTLKSEDGSVSGFGALCAAVGGQVGTGSLVGVASALAAGGPGALFWMWITALFGMVLSFAEASLGQLFHEKDKEGNYYGGAPYYMTGGLGCRPLAIAYAVATIFAAGICIAMLQNNSITSAVTGVIDVSAWIPGILVTLLAAAIIIGGVKRITDVASLIVPVMSISYLVITIIIVVTHIGQVPAMFALIFRSAFTLKATAGGVVGYTMKEAVRNGVARGLFSNDAGNGGAAAMHASAVVSHPANQGFSAMFGTFVTTIIICTCTGLVILLTGSLESGQDGINLVQLAFNDILGVFGRWFIMILTFLFCFTTLVADIFYGEVGIRYLFNGKKHAVEPVIKVYQAIVFVLITIGAVLPLPVLWDLVDFCAAFLVLFNVFTLLCLMKYVKYVLEDYTAQAGKGAKPVWDDTVGIKEKCK